MSQPIYVMGALTEQRASSLTRPQRTSESSSRPPSIPASTFDEDFDSCSDSSDDDSEQALSSLTKAQQTSNICGRPLSTPVTTFDDDLHNGSNNTEDDGYENPNSKKPKAPHAGEYSSRPTSTRASTYDDDFDNLSDSSDDSDDPDFSLDSKGSDTDEIPWVRPQRRRLTPYEEQLIKYAEWLEDKQKKEMSSPGLDEDFKYSKFLQRRAIRQTKHTLFSSAVDDLFRRIESSMIKDLREVDQLLGLRREKRRTEVKELGCGLSKEVWLTQAEQRLFDKTFKDGSQEIFETLESAKGSPARKGPIRRSPVRKVLGRAKFWEVTDACPEIGQLR